MRVDIAIGSRRHDLDAGGAPVLAPLPPRSAAPPVLAALAGQAVQALGFAPRRPVLIVPDRTRDARTAVVVPALIDALRPARPPICLFASGTHAPMREDEMRTALGTAFDDVVPTPHDAARSPFAALGDVRLHAAALAADALLVVSSMSFHYLAGFGGGRKMILPGVADFASTTRVHSACLDDVGRAPQATAGVLRGNPMHDAIVARLAGLPPVVGVCVVVENGAIEDAEAGELHAHHAALAARYAATRTVVVQAPLDGVLVSAGGAPYDVDLVQAHKALLAASRVVRPGGRIALVAALARGAGHQGLCDWIVDGTAEAQLARLLASFHIGRQTAYSLRDLLDRYDVAMCADPAHDPNDANGSQDANDAASRLTPTDLRRIGATPVADVDAAWRFVTSAGPHVAVAPRGAALRYVLEPSSPPDAGHQTPDGPPLRGRPT